MASVFVTTTAENTKWSPYARCNYERVLKAARHDSLGIHSLAADPADADMILFVEANSHFHFDVLRSPVYRKFTSKAFVFDSQDRAVPLVPGVYLDIPEHLRDSKVYQYGFYIRVFDNDQLERFVHHSQCEFLFSFMGKVVNCKRVRERVLALKHSRALLADSSSNQADNDARYVDVLQKSKFVICPRGFGASTWRCFEAMRAGRVPVIVSDSWFPPAGLNWSEFSLQIPEASIETIPEVLERFESDAPAMGLKARRAWIENFSLERSFHWLIERCLEIQPQVAANQRFTERNRLGELSKDRVVRFAKDYIRNMLQPVPSN
jgi:hypothetical protein